MNTAENAVNQIKIDLASYASSGKASRLLGIIVSSGVYEALMRDSENFHGVLGVSGTEGNRMLRYTFYVLRHPDFPVKMCPALYFFVGYPKEVYEKRYLGKEADILLVEERRKEKIGNLEIKEVNPICGIIIAGSRYLYDVDYEAVLLEAKKAHLKGMDMMGHILSIFDSYNFISNIPETRWIKDEKTYNYEKADIKSSVGRILMKRLRIGFSRNPSYAYQIVGVGINGYGDIIEVIKENSSRTDPYEFACLAIHYFLPEEVADFLHQYEVSISPEWVNQIPVWEGWGTWYDSEDIGRIKLMKWVGGNKEGYCIQGGFIGTRGKEYTLEIAKIEGEEGLAELKAKYFPADWKGWAETRQSKSMQAFAANL